MTRRAGAFNRLQLGSERPGGENFDSCAAISRNNFDRLHTRNRLVSRNCERCECRQENRAKIGSDARQSKSCLPEVLR